MTLRATYAALVIGLSTMNGCAVTPPPRTLGPLEPVVRAYSRNGIVCAPTLLGNGIGAVVGVYTGLVVVPVGIVSVGPLRTLKVWLDIGLVPSYLFGAILGTPFLPFSYLAPKTGCFSKKHADCDDCAVGVDNESQAEGRIE